MKIPMQMGGAGVLATSAENQTWAKQLSDLRVVYNTLSNDDKVKCVISSGSDVFSPMTVSGEFAKFFINGSAQTVIMALDVVNTTYKSGVVSSTVNDYSTQNHNRSMELRII